MYHGHVDETADTNGGMVGAMVISRPGTTDMITRKPLDVDREFITFYSIMDEVRINPLLKHPANRPFHPLILREVCSQQNDSPLLDTNVQEFLPGLDYDQIHALKVAVGETVILRAPPCSSLLKHLIMVQGGASNDSLADGCLKADSSFIESNQMHAINGRVYANLQGLVMTEGERVRWHLLALGNQEDIHTPHWHGQTLLLGNQGVLPPSRCLSINAMC